MPYAVTHVIIAIVIADLYRDYIAKKKFSKWYVLIAGIAGLLPDADIPFSWIFNFIFGTNYSFHRLFTHSLLWFMLLFFIGAAVYYFAKKSSYKLLKWNVPKDAIVMFFMAMAFGWLVHIFLDCALSADGYLNIIPTIPLTICPHPFGQTALIGIDAIILMLWLIHEQWHHEIKDYI
ncbi:hypothetical protein CO155_03385 [Candidatus Pacearchaeota archaeon CG_4_9_14_3_um_filter_35_19]|nr:MAG: hypothetical protein CO155_03385 [Candidatus Pacearchaeota archaeon CG_4_9_14_3_um_filter_35_19]